MNKKILEKLKAAKAAFFNGMKRAGKFILRNLDDIFMLSGIGCLAAAGFAFHVIAGLAVLGAGLISFGVIIAKGGGVNAAKKRSDKI